MWEVILSKNTGPNTFGEILIVTGNCSHRIFVNQLRLIYLKATRCDMYNR